MNGSGESSMDEGFLLRTPAELFSKQYAERVTKFINADSLSKDFQKSTRGYLDQVKELTRTRLENVHINDRVSECVSQIPEEMYEINLKTYLAYVECSSCKNEILIDYFNSVHEFSLAVFQCIDSSLVEEG